MLKALLAIARWRPLAPVIRFLFKQMNPLLPVDRLYENDDWMAFHHPQPDYPLHILILHTQGFAKLSEAPTDQPALFTSLFEIIKNLIKQFDLDSRGYRLITNGGPNQLIPQWHWHLISEQREEQDA